MYTKPRTKLSANLFLPKLQDVLFITIFLSAILFGERMLNLDGDLPRHLITGKYIIQNHTIPTTEKFIYPYFGQSSVPHEWLADVILYVIYYFWDLAGIVILAAFLLASTFTTIYNTVSNKLSIQLPVLFLLAWSAAATSINWAVRPHLFSMFLLSIWILWADELQKDKKNNTWKFPILMLIWSNVHGEFIAGILVLIAYASGWLVDYIFDRPNADPAIGKNILLALVLSLLASIINPSGIGPWIDIFGFVNNDYLMSRMVEANAPSFQIPELSIYFGLLIISILLLALKKDRLSTGRVFLLAGFTAMSLIAIRNIHLYGIVAPFILAETLVGTKNIPTLNKLDINIQAVESQLLRRGYLWSFIVSVVLGIIIIANKPMKNVFRFSESFFPVQAIEWVEKNPQEGNMFNDLNWGGYISLHLWPNYLTFVDSVVDKTGEVTLQYETVITLQDGWKNIFSQYNIRWSLIPQGNPLANQLTAEGWETIYKDNTSIILRKP